MPNVGKSERKRQGSEQTSSLASEGFWRGETIGRLVPPVGGGGVPRGSRCRGVRQWINSVLGTEKSTFLESAMALICPKAACRDLLLVRYEGEEIVREKSST